MNERTAFNLLITILTLKWCNRASGGPAECGEKLPAITTRNKS